MAHGRTALCHRDPRKGNSVERYCPVTCLPFIWKLLTEIIAEEMYDYLEQLKLETVARRTENMQTKKLWNKGSITY